MEAGGSGMKERDDNGEQTEEVKRQRLAAVELFTLVGQMKTTPRTGWVERGVPRPESVADHSYRMVRHKHTEGDIIKLCHDDSRAREEREREKKDAQHVYVSSREPSYSVLVSVSMSTWRDGVASICIRANMSSQ